MSSQQAAICVLGAREARVVFKDEPSRIRFGSLWPEDIARLRCEEGCKVVVYGIEDDCYHY